MTGTPTPGADLGGEAAGAGRGAPVGDDTDGLIARDVARSWLEATGDRAGWGPPHAADAHPGGAGPGTAGEAGRSVLDPAHGSPLAWVPYAGPSGVDAAVGAAREAGRPGGPWASLSRRARARALHAIAAAIRGHAPELAALQTLENGKLYHESLLDDLPDTADVFDYYAGWIDKLTGELNPVAGTAVSTTVREPVGVCALVVPWNFPLLLAAWKLAPALAMGNTVVLKPSEYTPLATLRMVELISEAADLPGGVLQVVVGDGDTGEALVSHPGVDKVSFTGSTAVGRRIVAAVAASNLATVTLELGGNAPNIVFDDVADLEAVVDRHARLLFSQKGEKCTEPARLLVQRAVHADAVELLVERAEALRCGDPFDPSATQGPQCTQQQHTRILELIGQGEAAGATVRCGGGPDPLASSTGGWYVQATVLDGITSHNPVDALEVFGPVAKVSVFDSEAEAIERANGTPFGLAAGVNTGSSARGRRVAAQLDAGQVFVNRYGCYDFASPFGGFKASGWGKEMGRASLDAYTRAKVVWTVDDDGS